MPELIITAVGPDRPGLVGELTGRVHAQHGNIADSRMVNLRGQFAIIMLVQGDAEALTSIQTDLAAASADMGLTVTVTPQTAPRQSVKGVPYRLKTYSMDQPGIVHRVSDLLRAHGVNIEEAQTRLESAPFAGEPLFTMDMRLTVPAKTPVRQLRSELEQLCDQLNCDVDLEPA
ncbi:MAG: ACT domain-containing protein [Phycisphaeraceae bacterium]